MEKKRHLRSWIQMLLEINMMLNLGILCSLNIIRVNLWTVLTMILLTAGVVVSGIILMKYGRYDDEL